MIEDNLYLSLIELGISSSGLEITNEVYTRWKQNSKYDEGLCNKMLHQCYDTVRKKDGTTVFLLKGEYYFNYIDYLELKEARQNAKEAKEQSTSAIKIAVWSIIISALVGAVSIFVQVYGAVTLNIDTIKQLTNPTTLKSTE